MRIIKILPKLSYINQTGYVKGRYRLIKDLFQYTKSKNMPGVLIAMDFEKRVDSLEWVFICSVLEKFGLPKKFIHFIYLNCTVRFRP